MADILDRPKMQDAPAASKDRGLRALVRDSARYGLGLLAARAASILLVPVLTRAFSTEGYGTVDLMASLTFLASMTLSLGLDSAIGRFFYDTGDPAERRSVLVTGLLLQVALSSVAVVLLVLSSAVWAGPLLGLAGQAGNAQLALAPVPMIAVCGSIATYLRCKFLIWRYNFLALAQLLLTAGFNLAAVATHRGSVPTLLSSTALAYALLTAVSLGVLGSELRGRWSRQRAERMLSYGLPLVPASIALWSLPLVGRFVVSHVRGSADVALLGVATRLVAVIGLGGAAFQAAWGPFALSVMRQGNARVVYSRTLTYVVVLGGAAAMLLSIAAGPILVIVAPPAYQASGPLIPWLAFGSVCTAAYYVTTVGASIAKRPVLITWSLTAAAAVNLVLAILLCVAIGVEGAAIASTVGLLVSALLPALMSRKHFPVAYEFLPLVPPVAILLTCSVIGAHLSVEPLGRQTLLRVGLAGLGLALTAAWARFRGWIPARS